MLWVSVCVGATSLAATMLLDSWMWNRQLLWPEGQVLWFNTALNKSAEYGTMPVHWYLTSALPKALLAPALLVPLGAWFDRYAFIQRLGPGSKRYRVAALRLWRFAAVAAQLQTAPGAHGGSNKLTMHLVLPQSQART
jgi:hypothetical protein